MFLFINLDSIDSGVFTHVTNAHTFGDKYLFYKFTVGIFSFLFILLFCFINDCLLLQYEEAEKKNKFLFMMEYRLEQVIEL